MNDKYLVLIPLLPLLGAILSGIYSLVYSSEKEGPDNKVISFFSCATPALACVLAFLFFFKLLSLAPEERFLSYNLYEWISSGNLNINVEFMLDPLSSLMILVITFIGTLIHIYSIGYMSHDRGFARYFSYLNLFTFSMLILVMSKNLVLMFLGWEGVGLCSYLLIGFWYSDPEKAIAGNKAFITNRIGDFAFLLGMFMIFWTLQEITPYSLDFEVLKANASSISTETVTIITLLLFIGAMGKSAQIPLHVWLPDAMAGPTPVSALIHAATMVTAGIYMIVRLNFLYSMAETTLMFIALVGILTAFIAATIAVTQDDIKKVLAYSTVSQLGYMFLAAGVGAYSAAVFHLFTHAFFKALLFLGSGSVIHAMSEEQNIWKMGGLNKKMKVTSITFFIGTLAIAGIVPFAGFWSKDEILWKVFESGNIVFYAIAVITAGLTAFYMARLYYVVFDGETRHNDPHVVEHIHESPSVMTLPLIILAIGSVIVGLLGIPHMSLFDKWLEPVMIQQAMEVQVHHGGMELELGLMALSLVVAIIGIVLAKFLYVKNPQKPFEIKSNPVMSKLYKISQNKWFFDETYKQLIITPLIKVSDYFLWRFMDKVIIDGFVNGLSKFYAAFSYGFRDIQSGKARYYAIYMMAGMLFIFVYIAFTIDLFH